MTLPSTTQRVLLQTDFDRFARLSHDDNPIHCDPDFAAKSHFGATVATGYRVHMSERSTIDVQIGIRYAQMDTQVSIEGVGQRDADNTIYDGILALRPRLALSKNWWFSPTMSIGAGDSDLTWELSPQFVYDCACGRRCRSRHWAR